MGKKAIIAAILVVLVLLQYACGGGDKAKDINKPTANPESPAGQVYQKYCAACHGADGKLGLSGAANLSISVLSKHEVTDVVTNGRRLMVPFKDKMTPAEIELVSEYVLLLRK